MKSVEVTMRFLVDVDDHIEINELDSRLVACFYHEDTYGTEHFLPKTEGLTITEYLDTTINSVTQIN
jgi:hypothetical protein